MSNVQKPQYEVYRPPMTRIKNENQFDIMMYNIVNSSIYNVIYPKIEEYIAIHHKKPVFKKYSGGVEFCQINNATYQIELDLLLIEYSKFYPKGLNKEYYSHKEIKEKNQKIKINRNYGPEGMISKLNTVDGLSDVYNKRINGLKDCIGKIDNNLRKEDASRYFLLEEPRLRKLKEFYNGQLEKEKGIQTVYDGIINYINSITSTNLLEKDKKEMIELVKKRKTQLISESLLYNNTNIPYNERECSENLNSLENIWFRIGHNNNSEHIRERKQLFLNRLKKLKDKYLIPQGKKAIILGRLETMFKYKSCKGLFHGAMEITPFFQIKPGQELCSKYVVYSLFMNRLLLAFSFAQNMDIPAIYNVYNELPDKIYKYVPRLKGQSLKKLREEKRFIGIIKIPYFILNPNSSVITKLYKYLFIFESPRTDLYPHYGIITHYEIYNQNLETIVYGTTMLKTTITYDELDALYWMSKMFKKELRLYFYRDKKDNDLNTYLFISTKPDLDDKIKYPLYDLEKISIEKWYEKVKYREPTKQFMILSKNQEKRLINEGKLIKNENRFTENIIERIKRGEILNKNVPPRVIKINSLDGLSNNKNNPNYLVATFTEKVNNR
jgi:hypothetical protein